MEYSIADYILNFNSNNTIKCPKMHPSSIPIIVLDMETNEEIKFPSIRSAAKKLKTSLKAIQRALVCGSKIKRRYNVRFSNGKYIEYKPFIGEITQIETGRVFDNLAEAARDIGASSSGVRDAIMFKLKIRGYSYIQEGR